MDDYNISAISEAKNEYSARLVNILTPLLIEGIKSIFKEALELCISNDEKDKYLMTFQNFLTRVPKWNQTIISQETKRIIGRSRCAYLEDLVTCVHISQLKILTSIRVASKQKKVDINVPKLTEFIHACYVQFARKLYSNVYLFETRIPSLQMQKNHRECELICKECILNVIRSNIPVDKILRAYIDETTEEEVIEESKVEEVPVKEEVAPVKEEVAPVEEGTAAETTVEKKNVPKGTEDRTDEADLRHSVKEQIHAENTKSPPKAAIVPSAITTAAAAAPPTQIAQPAPVDKTETLTADKSTNLSFDDKDKVVNYNKKENSAAIQTNTVETVVAPKTLERLEAISAKRHEERKQEDDEDDEEEKIKILDTPVDMKLDDLDVHVLDDKMKMQKELLKDVVELK
jgi:hypothetical protein